MAFGIGTRGDVGWGEADSWGGPMNSVDVVGHVDAGPVKWHSSLSVDSWIFIVMMLALAGLWLMGGVAFKNVDL